ncbi:hypothetical protein ACJMK2_035685 [Sinanodonta woodiana]|uniref:Uncharacterized protein n=1 Tax=Sinanodonta woodiana TaxID=1069815 RepID=A0ABD3WWA7_SINWO
MKLSCAISIVVLFVTAVNSTSTSSTATNTIASISTSTAATIATAAITSTTAAPTLMKYVCWNHTCTVLGCLTNATSASYCNGTFCTMVQRVTVIAANQTSYSVTAGCVTSCTEEDVVNGTTTQRTRCCQADKCNTNDAQIVALTKNGGSASYQAPVWILSIMMFISAFEILM